MQEINNARQESSAQSSKRKEYRCRVCDGPVEWPDLVCRKCWQRDREEQEWESYLDFLESDDTTPVKPEPPAEGGCRRSIPCERPKIIVLCEPSHVGKTTFARILGENFTIVSPDEIRKRLSITFGNSKHEAKVWDIYESMKCKALKRGHNVILDACHISKRARWHSLQRPNGHHRKICVVFDLPLRTIQKRCLKEKRMSLKEAERMWRAFQRNKPTPEELKHEGFDEVYIVKECPVCAVWISGWACIAGQPITGRCCHTTCRQHSRTLIVHYLQTGLSIQLEGQWYNNKGVRLWLLEFLAY